MKKFIDAITGRLIVFTSFMLMALSGLISPEKTLKAVDEVFAKMRK